MQENNQKLQLNGYNGGIAFAIMMVIYLLVSFLGQAVCGAIFEVGSTAYTAVCSTFSSIALLGVILFYVIYGKNKFSFAVNVQCSGGLYIVIALLLSVGMFAGLGFVNNLIAEILKEFNLNVSGISLSMPTFWHFLTYVITFAVMPAVFEEFFFRGMLLNCLSGVKRGLAIVISALCFALYHCSLVQFVYQFIYGVALGCMANLSKSVVPCMVAHFVNNFAIILFTFIGVNIDLLDPLVLVIGINALAIFCAIIYFAFKKSQKSQAQKGEGKNFFLPFGLFGLAICLALLIGNVVA